MPIEKALRTKAAVGGLEMEIRRRDGKMLRTIVNASPLFDDKGQVRGAVASYLDISERRAMEKLLRERADLVDLAPEAIMVRDELGLIRYWSAGAEALYGWKRDEVLNRHMHHTLATKFPVPYSEIEASLEDTGNWEGTLIQTTKDGRQVTVACRKTLNPEGGTSHAIMEINRNITGRLRLHKMVRRTG
jgi:PAS domain S-box-containing protein